MYIKMNSDKSLVITVPTTIYCGETSADIITFLIPSEYNEFNPANGAMMMHYILPDGTGKSEMLQYQPEMYKTYLQYSTLVNTKFTSQAGNVIIWLSVLDAVEDALFKTSEIIVSISPSKDIADYMPSEDLDAISQLTNRVSDLERRKTDCVWEDL